MTRSAAHAAAATKRRSGRKQRSPKRGRSMVGATRKAVGVLLHTVLLSTVVSAYAKTDDSLGPGPSATTARVAPAGDAMQAPRAGDEVDVSRADSLVRGWLPPT